MAAGAASDTDDRQQGNNSGTAPPPFDPAQRWPHTLEHASPEADHARQRHGIAEPEAEQQ